MAVTWATSSTRGVTVDSLLRLTLGITIACNRTSARGTSSGSQRAIRRPYIFSGDSAGGVSERTRPRALCIPWDDSKLKSHLTWSLKGPWVPTSVLREGATLSLSSTCPRGPASAQKQHCRR